MVVGYMIYLFSKRCLDVVNFAVHRHYRRRGVGTKMVEKLKSKIPIRERDSMEFIVSERNLAAQLFLASQRFRVTETLPRYYDDDDAFRLTFTKTRKVLPCFSSEWDGRKW